MKTASNISTIGTLASVPPEKRRVVSAAFNAFNTLADEGFRPLWGEIYLP